MRNNRNKSNQRTNRKQRHRNHAVLLKRTALNSHAVASQILPAKSYSPPNRKKGRSISESNIWKPKAASKSEIPVLTTGTSNNMNEKGKTTDTGGKNNLSGIHRWYNNPRITGAVAAVLLFATLAIAIIPISQNVRAEEQAETAALDPVRQLAKEYIYAGSRMLAIEDYGLSAGTPTPSPTPSMTPTPTPETPTPTPPTPTPPTPTPTPDTPTPTPTPETPTPTPSLTPTPTPTPNPTPTPCRRRCPTGQVLDLETCTCSGIIDSASAPN